MKKIFVILLSVLSLTVFAQQKKVAVYVTGEQSGVKKILADKLVEAITYSNRYKAIERTSSFLNELKKEQSYQRTGEVNDNEIARLGIQFGVNYVCVVDVIEEFGQKYITARLIDVETTEVITTGNASSELASMDELLECANKVATNITGKTAQELAEEATENARKREQKIQELKQWEQSALNNFHGNYAVIGNYMITRPIGPCFTATITWDKIPEVINVCRAGGYSDWRLPTASELKYVYEELQTIEENIQKKALEYYIYVGVHSSVENKSKEYIKEYKNKGYFDWIQNQYSFAYNKEVKYSGDQPYKLSLMLIRKK